MQSTPDPRIWAWLIALATYLAVAPPAVANDSSFGGEGAALMPLKETRVRMVSEDIAIRLRGERWHIVAKYQFHNPTGQAVPLQVGFPERACEPELSDCNGTKWTFQGIETTVRGQKVQQRIGTLSGKNAGKPPLGRVHLFDVNFAPGEKVAVVHEFQMMRSIVSVTYEALYYVTRTGAGWNGPIESARFDIELPWRPWYVALPSDYPLTSFTEQITPDGPRTSMVIELRNWTPKRDLAVYFESAEAMLYADAPEALAHCPPPTEFAEGSNGDERRIAARARLAGLSRKQLKVCRNMVYAAHGYPFRAKRWRKLFYRPRDVAWRADFDKHPWTAFNFRQNPHWSPELLTPAERLYINEIKRLEKLAKRPRRKSVK